MANTNLAVRVEVAPAGPPLEWFFSDPTRTRVLADGAVFETSRLLDGEAVALSGAQPDALTALELVEDVARQADDAGARYFGGVL